MSLLPAVESGSGPFAGRFSSWSVPEHELTDGQRAVVVSYYLALVTCVCLGEIGAQGSTVVEGPFAANAAYCEMLEAATRRPVVRAKGGRAQASAPRCWSGQPGRRRSRYLMRKSLGRSGPS